MGASRWGLALAQMFIQRKGMRSRQQGAQQGILILTYGAQFEYTALKHKE